MAKLTSWKANSSTFRVTSKCPTMPAFYASLVRPPTLELDSVSAKELADGWPQAIVDRAHARRTSTTRMWQGPNGITLGPRPHVDIVGDGAFEWMETVAAIQSPEGHFPAMWYYQNHAAGSYADPATHQLYMATVDAQEKLVKFLTGVDLNVTDCTVHNPFGGTYYGITVFNRTQALDYARTLVSETKVVIGLAVDNPDGMTWFICDRPSSWKGLDALLYSVNNHSGPDAGSALDAMLPLHACLMSQGWFDILCTYQPLLTGSTNDIGWKPGLGHLYVTRQDPQITFTPVVGTHPFGTVLNPGPELLGLAANDVYHIGDPEFANSFSIKGATVWDALKAELAVDSPAVFVTWEGQRLIDMTPNMTQEDQDSLRSKMFVSMVTESPWTGQVALTDLAMYAQAVEAEMDLANEVFMKANGSNPEVKFSEAVVRANAGDRKIYHQMRGFDKANWVVPDRVRFTGNKLTTGVIATMYSGTTIVTGTLDDAMSAVANGAQVQAATDTFPDTCVEDCFGVSLPELLNNKDRWQAKDDFNEEKVFKRGLPDVYSLPAPKRSAMLMMQHAMNRRAMSSFVVGALTMAGVARRTLL